MDDTKERILSASLDLFSAKGFAAVCTKAIAELADVNEVTIFRLFGSKRNLYIEVFKRFSIFPKEDLILADVRGDIREDLRAVGRTIAALFLRNGKIVRMSMKDMESFPEINSVLRDQPEVLISIVEGYFERASVAASLRGEPHRLARVFVISLMGTVLHLHRFSGDKAVYDFADDFIDVLSRGMMSTPS